MTYAELIEKLTGCAEEEFALFQEKLIFTKYKILGVRTPIMRKIAKELKGEIDTLLSFPDEYYEVVFIKLCAVAELPFEAFIGRLSQCVSLMDNWALTDCFKIKCLKNNKERFLPYLEEYFSHGGEFYERFVLTALLFYYTEEKYIPLIEGYLSRADTSKYYAYMAAAWLLAELLIKYPTEGERIIKEGVLDEKTQKKGIQKAKESFRLSVERKKELDKLKNKNWKG